MQADEKWIAGIAPSTRLVHAARHSLKLRLKAVWDRLPLAADHADEDVEHIHQLRVLTRRSIAVLDLYEPVLKKRSCRWMRKTLKQVRRAAGDARDMDVLALNTLKNADVEENVIAARVARLREEAQQPVQQIHRKLSRRRRWKRHYSALMRQPGGRRRERGREQFQPWACRKLQTMARDFLRSVPSSIDDMERLHQFRIEGKRLRYAIELLSSAFPAKLRQEIYPTIEAIQEKLGAVHDRHVAAQRFRRWAAQSTDRSEQAQLETLAHAEEERLIRLQEEFRDWWSPELRSKLRRMFRKVIRRAEQRC